MAVSQLLLSKLLTNAIAFKTLVDDLRRYLEPLAEVLRDAGPCEVPVCLEAHAGLSDLVYRLLGVLQELALWYEDKPTETVGLVLEPGVLILGN